MGSGDRAFPGSIVPVVLSLWGSMLVPLLPALGATPEAPVTESPVTGAPVTGDPGPRSAAGLTRSLTLEEVIALTLASDPNIGLAEADLASARGVLLVSRGEFDPTVTSSLSRQQTKELNSADSENLRATVGVSQRLRSGLELTPAIEIRRTEGEPVLNDAAVSFEVRQPLLRDRGRRSTAALELSAEWRAEAGRLDLEHTIAQRLRAAIAQYWLVTAVMADLEILRMTEESSRRLLETTRRLIEADITPAAELVLLEADLTSKEADRIAGERTLFRARLDLSREIGLAPAEMTALPLPREPFPSLDAARLPAAGAAAGYTRQALEARADLQAARARLSASEILLAAAENDLRPRLDLVLVPSYSGLIDGAGVSDFFESLVGDIPGLSTRVALDLTWPTWNRQAEGNLLQAQSAVERSRLGIDVSVRQIGADVPISLDAASSNALQVELAERAVDLFEQAVVNEEKKLRGGSSTLIDVLSQRDRLTASRRRLVAARRDLALALLELRFQTGTLVGREGDRHTVRVLDFTTFPSSRMEGG